jgi:putative membrane protein
LTQAGPGWYHFNRETVCVSRWEDNDLRYLLDILRGMVIGLANIIPGVSGGTMMVSMGIYDKLIHSITHLFKEFWRSVKTLLPYVIGMAIAIVLGAFGLKYAFAEYPLPTNALFIGMILGSVPMILAQMKGEKIGVPGVVVFLLFFGLVVGLKLVEGDNRTELRMDFLGMVICFLLGAVASSTMVIPGVSGSMILKTLGYYEPIVTQTLTGFLSALKAGDWATVGQGALVLVPFVLGIAVGIFAIAKLIEVLLRKWKGVTYCAILGMVVASPVAILMDKGVYAKGTGWGILLVSVVTFVLGFLIALKLGGKPEETAGKS